MYSMIVGEQELLEALMRANTCTKKMSSCDIQTAEKGQDIMNGIWSFQMYLRLTYRFSIP